MNGPHTPGILGYLLALIVSWLVFAVFVVVPGAAATGDPLNALGALIVYVPIVMIAGAIYGLPIAVAGVIVVHLLCFQARDQWIHVLAAGLIGIALAAVQFHWFLNGPPGWSTVMALVVGLAAAVGRLAVLPLVTSRRRLAAQGRLTGTARW